MHEYVSITKAAQIIGVTPKTMRVWDNEGVLKSYKTPKGHRRYPLDEIESLALGRVSNVVNINNKVYIYSRVSTKKQCESGNLDRQTQRLQKYCLDKDYEVVEIYNEVASGLNDKRPKLSKMLSNLEGVSKIIVEYPDRLARFGLNYLILMLKNIGITVEFVEDVESKSINEDMTKDIISIITCFSTKLYGATGGRKVKKTLDELAMPKSIEKAVTVIEGDSKMSTL
ncbi:IS607 family transposase [Clostridium estertheticum]|uniref:IS607 family transposase n=1 Tax=Clostridium estertheticum TaxID=238834 RepID=UPI001CF5EC0F|nr:IS607 family transposase [Clostridium estertheticum]MCB2353658.1 IS607 family transposase [Clostridium estertheticum]WAG40633.1 IS607 family transposase [Clostridium estertheticum]